MTSAALILILFTAVVAALGLLIALRPELTRARGGKVLAFVGLCVLPGLAVWAGGNEHLERSTSTQFCLSCHVMGDFGNDWSGKSSHNDSGKKRYQRRQRRSEN